MLEQVDISSEEKGSRSSQDFEYFHSQDSFYLDSRVQQALNKINQMIFQLKVELDDEKSKNITLEEKINSLIFKK